MIGRLEALGLLNGVDQVAVRRELRELDAALEAVEVLQAWVEQQLASYG